MTPTSRSKRTDDLLETKLPDHVADGWWEYGVGGYVHGSTEKPLEPHWCMSRLEAEIQAERVERLYVVRRWVRPGPWETVDADDHPGVTDWEWAKYLEWRDERIIRAGKEARKRLEIEEGEA